MNIIKYPARAEWGDLVKRPQLDVSQLNAVVAEVLAHVKEHGDAAVKGYEQQFDHAVLQDLAVSKAEMDAAETLVSS